MGRLEAASSSLVTSVDNSGGAAGILEFF